MPQLEKIFQGVTPASQRRFVASALVHLRAQGYERVVVPCAGQFAVVRCALEAGFKPEQVEVSEVSLFSTVLGKVLAGGDLADLEVRLADPWRAQYARLRSGVSRAAFLLWAMKVAQLKRAARAFEGELVAEYEERADVYRDQLRKQLTAMLETYGGIRYDVRDLRDVVREPRASSDVVAINPPAYRGGYAKQFDFAGLIEWDAGIAEFDFDREIDELYEISRTSPAPFLWRTMNSGVYKSRREYGAEIVFAEQYAADRVEYWTCTKPELLDDMPGVGSIATRIKERPSRPYPAPAFGDEDELSDKSRVEFVRVDQEVGLYYRDLWAHKMGQTRAETYLLMLVDGKVFATVGLIPRDLLRLVSDRVHETYGFSVQVRRYPRANRLLMMCLTSGEFGEVVHRLVSDRNRIYTLRGLRTTCLSKYRKVKLNNGLLDLELREKLPSGMYRLVYDAEFRPDTFADCVRRFLDEELARSA